MAGHPHNEHRQHHVEHRRVAHITKGYAHGGSVEHSDAKADVKLIKHSVKKSALKAHGEKPKHRADHRARGGRIKHGGKGATINILNSPGHAAGGVPMPGMAPPMARPPMPAPPQGAMPPPGMPPGAPPPGGPMMGRPGMPMPGAPGMIRRSGGRAYATGGGVKDGPAWKEGLKNGTQVDHHDGKMDGKDVGRRRVVTFMAGGAVEHPKKGGMAPKFEGGAGGGEARLAKEKLAKSHYAKT